VILVDARKGVVEQTRRHGYIASILGIAHVVAAVNKMDLVEYSQERYDEIVAALETLRLPDLTAIPLSALKGDNVVDRGESMPWYDGPTLLEQLESVEPAGDRNLDERRFPVQWVIRPMSEAHHDYRGYAGRVAGGVWRAGDDVLVLPSGRRSKVAAIAPDALAVAGMSATIQLEDDLDVGRGDMLVDPERAPEVVRELEATVCWMSERPLKPRSRLLVKHTTRTVPAIADELLSAVDIHLLEDRPGPAELGLNDIGLVRLRLAEPLVVDPYQVNRATGALILIDEATNDTVGAGMIR
jgi:bifunctional enzyme CysN/CysC